VKGHKYIMHKYKPANHILMGDGSARDALIGYNQTGDMVLQKNPKEQDVTTQPQVKQNPKTANTFL